MQKWKKLDENEKKRNQIIGIFNFYPFLLILLIIMHSRKTEGNRKA